MITANSKIECLAAMCGVLAVAFVLRLAWAMLIPVVPVSDSEAYDLFARILAEHGVYGWNPDQPSAYWPVGTSAIYAALYSVFGFNYSAIVALNVALGTAIVGLTMWLGRTFFDNTTAIIAGGVMALWPIEIAYVTVLASELPFTFLVLLGFVAWCSPRPSNSARAVATGLAFGAAGAHFRPIALLLPIVLWLSASRRQRVRERFLVMLFAMIVIALSITPWSARNTRLFGHFVLLSTNEGTNLWMGNNRMESRWVLYAASGVHTGPQ